MSNFYQKKSIFGLTDTTFGTFRTDFVEKKSKQKEGQAPQTILAHNMPKKQTIFSPNRPS